MSLQDWATNGWLVEHQTSAHEISELLAVADRDLSDCRSAGLSADWQLNIAYNAALQLGVAALAASGYRAGREAHHYRTIQSFALTIGLDAGTVRQLEAFRKKRNVGEYQRAGAVSDREVGEIVALASCLRQDVEHWLRAAHPDLLSELGG